MNPHDLFIDKLTNEGNKTIELLESLKLEIQSKQENILEQSAQFETRLHKLTTINKTIKIDTKQQRALHDDCAHYHEALRTLITDIDSKVAGWNTFLSSEKSPLVTKKDEELVLFSIYLKHRITQTKKFIKKINKDVTVAHSRFSFGFDTQQKQLNYLEHISAAKR